MSLAAHVVSYAVAGRALVDRADCRFAAGTLNVIAGPNGAGKSTLLQLLAGEIGPTEGRIELDGTDISDLSAHALAQRRAVLPQASTVAFPFTAIEIVAMGRTPTVDTPLAGEDMRVIRNALALADATGLADRIYTTLSGGEQQRIQLARVLAQVWDAPADQTRVALLDEPTSSLDLAHQVLVMDVARTLADAGFVVVAVLHDLNLAAAYSDRLILMKEGGVVADGAPAAVVTREVIGAVFECDVALLRRPHSEAPLMVPLASRLGRRGTQPDPPPRLRAAE